ncbi:MAG: sulfatase-like hydrolase/transferase [Planctomycetes bacterium]|nr:sulfatase-like hydrolase/transferase [Planctomycetota bacterium]
MRRAIGLPILILAALYVSSYSRLPAQDEKPHNVLLLVLDDVGTDKIGAYHEGQAGERTPTFDRLARNGVLFRNAWSNPLCSPTRACIQTGRYGFRTGIGTVIEDLEGHSLQLDEVTIPEAVDGAGLPHESAAIGKWHLSNRTGGASLYVDRSGFLQPDVKGFIAPNLQGYDHFAGATQNVANYNHWMKIVDGDAFRSSLYVTSDNVDSARDWIRSRGGSPWICYIAFNAAHVPYNDPPAELHTYDDRPLGEWPSHRKKIQYYAVLEAMDTELARFFRELGGLKRFLQDTTVLVIGDNGTGASASDYLPWRSKGTVYEAGVNVPLIACGADVPARGECEALVGAVDLFATTLELAGVPLDDGRIHDSVSLVPYFSDPHAPARRGTVFAEYFTPNGYEPTRSSRAIRNARYKLIRKIDMDKESEEEEFYDLATDPRELRDLLRPPVRMSDESEANYLALSDELDCLLKSGS